MRKVGLWLGLLALIAFALADVPSVSVSNLQSHVKTLASPEMEGRLAIAPGGHKAGEYIARMFAEYGLEPKGTQGYFQDFEMTIGYTTGKDTALRVEFANGNRWEVPADAFRPSNLSDNTTTEGEVVFVGYGLSLQEPAYDDYAGVDVKGKVVAILRGAPEWLDAGTAQRVARIPTKLRTAFEKGATGVILLNLPNQPLLPLGMRGRASVVSGAVVNVNTEVANRLLRTANLTVEEAVKRINETKQPVSVALPVKVAMTVQLEPRKGIARNVVGFLPGADPNKREEIIVIGAHYDHLGYGEVGSLAFEPGEIHYGADDNASGTAGLLELARILSLQREKLPRSVLFIAFSGEEEGLVGSAYFVRNPTVPTDKIVAMINLDMIGRLREDRLSISGLGSSPQWEEIVKAANTDGLTLNLSQASTGGSDHTSFFMANIPVLFFFTGMHPEYHRPTDTWDTINYEGQAKVVAMVERVACHLAQREERIAFSRPSQPAPATGARAGFRVRIGIIPEYSGEANGVLLGGVVPGSPAEKAGLKAGDRIVAVMGKQVKSIEELTQLYDQMEPGKPVEFTIVRNGQEMKVQVVPAAPQ